MVGSSWRFKFIDIDNSFTLNAVDDNVLAYTVVRAPKGTTEPMFFASGNEEAIYAMIGLPTANWPDIKEAVDFDNEYGVYISAPPGSSSAYPSYYGGSYITKYGVYPFYKVTDKDNLNYITNITAGKEKTYDSTLTGTSSIAVTSLGATAYTTDGNTVTYSKREQMEITISGIPASIFSKITQFDFNVWKTVNGFSGTQTYYLDKTTSNVYHVSSSGTGTVVCGTLAKDSTGTYSIVLGGKNAANTATSTSEPYLWAGDLVDATKLFASDGTLNSDYTESAVLSGLTAGSLAVGTDTVTFSAVTGRFNWLLYIFDDIYMAVYQKSPTETPTNITISDIGYDKYAYDIAMQYAASSSALSSVAESSVTNPDGYVGVYAGGKLTSVYQYSASATPAWTDVTDDLATKAVRITTPVTGSGSSINKIFYIAGASNIIEETEDDADHPLVETNTYNKITIACNEEVYPGETTDGGTITGSLDESGTDDNGSDDYFLTVLPDDSLSFIEVSVIRTFDSDTTNGFFTGTRFADKYGSTTYYSGQIKGQRYVTSLVNANIAKNILGCNSPAQFETTVKLGWTEAKKSIYDCCHLFFEPTGLESLKTELKSVRAVNQVSFCISPKVITEAEYENPSKISVSSRDSGTAQYIGEFQVKDSYTQKKYWRQPIGAVAKMLARIIDKRYGGVAPMYANEDGMGGIIDVTALKQKWNWSDAQTKIIDKKGLNPIILTTNGDVEMIGDRTTQDPDNGTDKSYIGHVLSFDLCKREIRDNVMGFLLGKAIDDWYMDIAQTKVDDILAKRISGDRKVWKEAKAYVKTVNTDTTKAARKFCLKVRVKVNPYAETVELTFVNEGQSTSIS